VASDALFENVPTKEIQSCTKELIKGNALYGLNLMAHCLSEKVRDLSLLTDSYSPFSKHAENFETEWKGGKPDDVTIIVSHIQSEANWQVR